MGAPEWRYLAGFTGGGGQPSRYSLWKVAEQDGKRLATPEVLVGNMTRDQAEHLHMQLTNVLAIDLPVPQAPDDNGSSGS